MPLTVDMPLHLDDHLEVAVVAARERAAQREASLA
jgi:hypothetical protein